MFTSLTYILALLIGTPTNLLSFLHFYKTRNLISSLLHSLMNFTDLIICLLVSLLPAITNLISTDLSNFTWKPVCYVWYILQLIAIRYSVFLIGFVSVLRTHSILRPLAAGPNRKYLCIFLFSYVLYLAGRLAMFLLNGIKPVYYHPTRVCQIIVTEDKGTHVYLWLLADDLETFLPMIIILISCFLTVHNLQRTGVNRHSARKRRATVTVVILTVVCIAFNLPHAIDRLIIMVYFCKSESPPFYLSLFEYDPNIYFALKSTFVNPNFMGCISSVINPIVIILRVNMLNKFKINPTKQGKHTSNPTRQRSGSNDSKTRQCLTSSPR